MDQFNKLLDISNQLLGPNGCQWDQEQTLFTLQPYLLEETHELIEAIDLEDFDKICEEVGDVFFALVFIAKVAEKQGKFTIFDSIQATCEKLIRRHPHVFGDVKITSKEDFDRNWEEIKKREKAHEKRKKIFDGIPPTLPLLAKGQKMAGKLRKAGSPVRGGPGAMTEAELGERLWELVAAADRLGIDAESAFRRKLQDEEGKSI